MITILARLPIIPEHVWRAVEDPSTATIEQAVGSGPYRLISYEPGTSYRLEANTDYAFDTPTVQQLLVPIILEPATTFAALRTGEIDATFEEVDPRLAAELRQDANLAL